MTLGPYLAALYIVAALLALAGVGHAIAARRHWRLHRRVAALHRSLWCVVAAALAALAALLATSLVGYRRLTAEAPVARVATQRAGDHRFDVTVTPAGGPAHSFVLDGDDWQIDARIIKWQPFAVALGAPPVYRLDRIGARWRDIDAERTAPRSVFALSPGGGIDRFDLARHCPRWLCAIDADYGSAAYLPMVDGGAFDVTLSATGGLVARPADAATAARLAQMRY